MMIALPSPSKLLRLAAVSILFGGCHGANVVPLVGTWATKSNTVRNGPEFWDYKNELFKEPRLPGMAFSFTSDFYYEEAIYVMIPNPTTPSCPKAVIQFQHGSYVLGDDGSITLKPLAVDGRQLLSDPCESTEATYTRYNQTEIYKKYEIVVDNYVVQSATAGQYPSHFRLNLFKFDGAPMQPLYRLDPEPKMHPTTTLRPTNTAQPTSTKAAHVKRAFSALKASTPTGQWKLDLDTWWYIGLVMTVIGGIGFFYV